jgi:DMSO/TMAO reductase YedYZ molybdopterin-dependent catalytic subunit
MRRREFLVLAGVGTVLGARPLRADHHIDSADPLVMDFDLQSLKGRYTPLDDFYIRNHFAVPTEPAGALLQVNGEVRKPLSLGLAELSRLHAVTLGAVLECAGSGEGPRELASNGLWHGWRLSDIVSMAEPAAGAKFLHLHGRDGFARSVLLDGALANGLLATELNHEPLRPNHGARWRALFPGWYGMDSVKWLARIEVSREALPADGDAYLKMISTPSGQIERVPLPPVQVKSVITSPAAQAVLHVGSVEVAGVAWSGLAPVRAVEVSADGGATWRAARLDPGSRFEWVLWQCRLTVSKRGVVEFACRAADEKGNTQPASRAENRLDGYVDNLIEHVRCLVV